MAEIIFTLQHAIPDMQEFRADIHARMEQRGRRPEECQILVSVDPIMGGPAPSPKRKPPTYRISSILSWGSR